MWFRREVLGMVVVIWNIRWLEEIARSPFHVLLDGKRGSLEENIWKRDVARATAGDNLFDGDFAWLRVTLV